MPGDTARRLATIVAVDAAGYSHQSEMDEKLAVREIAALSERVSACATSHGGRVFNTAGDGFMLEFPTASGALECAEELLANSRVPLRIGIHLGEVFLAPGGDLLGRGVNVAARLRELAEPGGLRVSGEVRRSLPAPGGERLVSRGTVKLSKMDERVEMYAIAAPWRLGGLGGLRFMPRGRAAFFAGAGFAAAALVAFVVPTFLRDPNDRVAVLDFQTDGGAELTSFAEGLSDQIIRALSAGDLRAIPPARSEEFRASGLGVSARRVGAGFALDGAVRDQSGVLQVNMLVVDARTSATLWSSEYHRTSAESAYMQEQLATHVADVLRCALISRRPTSGEIDPETLAIFLRACDRVQRYDQGPEEMYEAARRITERAPRFSRGWSMLAMASALAIRTASPENVEELRQEARAAASRASALDRGNAEADLALSLALAEHDWAGREGLIARALAKEPNSPDAHIFQGNFLAQVGRLEESLTHYRRAVALDPLSPIPWADMLPLLSGTGRMSELQELRDRLYRTWPDSPSVWYNRFNNSVFARQPAVALAILENETAPIVMEQPMRQAWRRFLRALESNDRQAVHAAVVHIADMARRREFDMPRSISAASLVGEADIGFSLAEAYFNGEGVGIVSGAPVAGGHRFFLFLRPGEAMRRDPRFIALARQLGLVDYWTQTGKWPDFCAEPGLPYNCRAEAARLSP